MFEASGGGWGGRLRDGWGRCEEEKASVITSVGKVNFNVHMTETVYSCQGRCQASQACGVRVLLCVRSFLMDFSVEPNFLLQKEKKMH